MRCNSTKHIINVPSLQFLMTDKLLGLFKFQDCLPNVLYLFHLRRKMLHLAILKCRITLNKCCQFVGENFSNKGC